MHLITRYDAKFNCQHVFIFCLLYGALFSSGVSQWSRNGGRGARGAPVSSLIRNPLYTHSSNSHHLSDFLCTSLYQITKVRPLEKLYIVVTKFNNQSHTHNLYLWPPQYAIASYSTVSRIVETPGHLYTKLVEWQYIHRFCAGYFNVVANSSQNHIYAWLLRSFTRAQGYYGPWCSYTTAF